MQVECRTTCLVRKLDRVSSSLQDNTMPRDWDMPLKQGRSLSEKMIAGP